MDQYELVLNYPRCYISGILQQDIEFRETLRALYEGIEINLYTAETAYVKVKIPEATGSITQKMKNIQSSFDVHYFMFANYGAFHVNYIENINNEDILVLARESDNTETENRNFLLKKEVIDDADTHFSLFHNNIYNMFKKASTYVKPQARKNFVGNPLQVIKFSKTPYITHNTLRATDKKTMQVGAYQCNNTIKKYILYTQEDKMRINRYIHQTFEGEMAEIYIIARLGKNKIYDNRYDKFRLFGNSKYSKKYINKNPTGDFTKGLTKETLLKICENRGHYSSKFVNAYNGNSAKCAAGIKEGIDMPYILRDTKTLFYYIIYKLRHEEPVSVINCVIYRLLPRASIISSKLEPSKCDISIHCYVKQKMDASVFIITPIMFHHLNDYKIHKTEAGFLFFSNSGTSDILEYPNEFNDENPYIYSRCRKMPNRRKTYIDTSLMVLGDHFRNNIGMLWDQANAMTVNF